MAHEEEFGLTYARRQIARRSNPLRRLVKAFYVARVLRYVNGPSIDFGCGVGQILERLPDGSVGIEVNPYLVEDLARRGLKVMPAAESETGFDLSPLRKNEFRTLVLSHVLEHFQNADQILRKLLHDCASLGISTVIVVIPGEAGFRSDSTHKTFINLDYLISRGLVDCNEFRIAHSSHFPFNFQFFGKFFAYHEFMVVYRATKPNK